MLSVYQVPHISKTLRRDSFKASAKITLGAQASTDEKVLRTGLTEIEGRRHLKLRTSWLMRHRLTKPGFPSHSPAGASSPQAM